MIGYDAPNCHLLYCWFIGLNMDDPVRTRPPPLLSDEHLTLVRCKEAAL